MDWQKACMKSDFNTAVRLNKVGIHVYRDSDIAWIYDADFRKIVVEKEMVDVWADWNPL